MTKLLFGNSSDRNIFYASRANIHDPFYFLEKDGTRHVFLNGLEFGAFVEKNRSSNIIPVQLESIIEGVARIQGEGSGAGKLAYVILEKYNLLSEVVYVPANFPVELADYLRSKNVQVKVESPIFPERAVKSSDEISALREVCKRTEVAFGIIEKILKESVIAGNELMYERKTLTSEYLKVEAERVLLEKDLLNVEDMIVSCGPQAAMPHHRGSGVLRPYQTIVCDIYPQHRATGYFADISRTYIKGEPSVELQNMYNAVFEAQKLAMAAVRPGVTFESVQRVAQEYFLAHGFEVGNDRGFTHSIGHGLGVEVHEQPFVRSKGEAILEPGNVITIEPGLYYPGLGGVRLEDVVLVTETGYELLSPYHKRWII